MTKVAEFHTTGIEDVDELVYHNQSECPIGQEVTKKGTAAPGQGIFSDPLHQVQGHRRWLGRESPALADVLT